MTPLNALLGFLPGFVWLGFFLQEDIHPEPKRLVAFTFLTGCAAAVIGFGIELIVMNFFKSVNIADTDIIGIATLAAIEEIVKFGAAWLAVHKDPEFDEPIDAMIYTMAAALGFATIENIGAIAGAHALGQPILQAEIEAMTLRFVGATLLHSIASSLVGFYWAQSIRYFKDKKILIKGLFWATILHTAFNFIIIRYSNLMFTLMYVVILGFFILTDFEKLKAESI